MLLCGGFTFFYVFNSLAEVYEIDPKPALGCLDACQMLVISYNWPYIIFKWLFSHIMDNILPHTLLTTQEIRQTIADRFRRRRLDHHNWPRHYLASKSGVTESTIKRFEKNGQITLENLIRLAQAMDSADELLRLFPLPSLQTIAELEQRSKQRQRGRRKP